MDRLHSGGQAHFPLSLNQASSQENMIPTSKKNEKNMCRKSPHSMSGSTSITINPA